MTRIEAPRDSRESSQSRPRPNYRAGDLVTPTLGYPILYEVLAVEREGTLRVRGVNWAAGYSALVRASEVRPVTQILQD